MSLQKDKQITFIYYLFIFWDGGGGRGGGVGWGRAV